MNRDTTKIAIKKAASSGPNALPILKKKVVASEPPAEGTGLRLAIYQGPGLCGDRKAIEYNLKNLASWAEKASKEKAQLLGVAELFLCGYNIRPNDREAAAVTMEEARDLIVPIAIENNISLLVPYAEKIINDTKMFDSMILVDEKGVVITNYRKTQLWGHDEKTVWQYPYVEDPENAYKVVKVNGMNVGLLNCCKHIVTDFVGCFNDFPIISQLLLNSMLSLDEAEFPELNRILALKVRKLNIE